MNIFRIAFVAIALSSLAACGGGGAKVTNTTVSEGQQLIDLKKAYDLGVITEKEYEMKRKKILNG